MKFHLLVAVLLSLLAIYRAQDNGGTTEASSSSSDSGSTSASTSSSSDSGSSSASTSSSSDSSSASTSSSSDSSSASTISSSDSSSASTSSSSDSSSASTSSSSDSGSSTTSTTTVAPVDNEVTKACKQFHHGRRDSNVTGEENKENSCKFTCYFQRGNSQRTRHSEHIKHEFADCGDQKVCHGGQCLDNTTPEGQACKDLANGKKYFADRIAGECRARCHVQGSRRQEIANLKKGAACVTRRRTGSCNGLGRCD